MTDTHTSDLHEPELGATSRRIVFTRPDGGLAVLVPATGGRLVTGLRGGGKTVDFPPGRRPTVDRVRGLLVAGALPILEPEADWLARLRATDVPADAAEVAVVDLGDFPADRAFRGAWRLAAEGDAVAVTVDMGAARQMQMARIRQARDAHPDWAKIDQARRRAQDKGEGLPGWAMVRAEQLRDLPELAWPGVEAAATPEELAAVWPTALDARVEPS